MVSTAPVKFGVGQSARRKEDDALVRGRGRYTGQPAPSQWADAVRSAIEPDAAQWLKLWQQVRSSSEQERPSAAALQAEAEQLLQQALTRAMERLYPGLE